MYESYCSGKIRKRRVEANLSTKILVMILYLKLAREISINRDKDSTLGNLGINTIVLEL